MNLRSIGLLAIIVFTIAATILSTSVNMEGYELGAMFNLILPGFIGIIAIIFFLLTYWLSKRKEVRIAVLIICCGYLLYVGLFFKIKSGYLPFPFD